MYCSLWHVSQASYNQGVAMLRAEGTSLRQDVSDADFILHGASIHPGGKSYKTGVLKSPAIKYQRGILTDSPLL